MGLAEDILSRIPPRFDEEQVTQRYPTTYQESMNTVLTQECIRYNNLLTVMERSLKETIKALKGLVVMSPELERVAYAMYDNQVRFHSTVFPITSTAVQRTTYKLPLMNSMQRPLLRK